MFELKLAEHDEGSSQVGGGAWLTSLALWPVEKESGQHLLPLLTIRQELFVIPTLPEGMAITIFLPFSFGGKTFGSSAARRFAANDQSQFDELLSAAAGATALLHQIGNAEVALPAGVPTLPKYRVVREPMNGETINEETRDEDNGAEISKLFGRPAWLQDPVRLRPKFSFCLQILESDLREAHPLYDGIFRDGIGYFFINLNCKKMKTGSEAGKFFVQFT